AALLGARRADPAARPAVAVDLLPPGGVLPDLGPQLARDRFEAGGMRPEEGLRARHEAARMVCEVRLQEFLARRGFFDVFLDASERMLRARHELGGDADPAPLLEGLWRGAREADAILRGRYEAARVGSAEAAEARERRLAVEMELARLKERRKQP